MKYSQFTAFDFAMDDDFIQWVLHPNPENEVSWKEWLAAHPDKAEVIEEAVSLVRLMNFRDIDVPDELIRKTRQEVFAAIDDKKVIPLFPEANPPGDTRPTLVKEKKSKYWLKVAAAFIGVLLVSSLLLFFLTRTTETYATGYGETKNVLLPDGSGVIINANSSVKYTAWLSFQPREVTLTGEAFFKVVHTANHQPFRVKAANLTVEVLGTTFNVQNRRNQAQVVLTSGKVKITPKIKSQNVNPHGLVMQPGEMVMLESNTNKLHKKRVNPELYTAWKNNKLVFVATPLRQIANLLEDNYGFQVQFSSTEIEKWEFTGSASTHDIDSFLEDLIKLYNLKIEKHGKKLTIRIN